MPLSPLARGRLITLAGALLLCVDTPVLRVIRLNGLQPGSAMFGFGVAMWRGGVGVGVYALNAAWHAGSLPALREQTLALGAPCLAAVAALLAVSQFAFTVGVTLTSAANVLVLIALGPLVAALLGRVFLSALLPLHSWIACAAGFLSVALVFAGSMDAGGLAGCFVAAFCPLTFAAYLTLSTHKGEVSLAPGMPLSGVVVALVSLAVLGPRCGGAAAADASDGLLLIFNAAANALAQVLVTVGSQTVPAAECVLICLIETALSPFLVYALVGEKPSGQTIAAAVLILLTLTVHAAYDMYLEKRNAGGAHAEEEGRELLPAAAAEEEDGGRAEIMASCGTPAGQEDAAPLLRSSDERSSAAVS